MKVYVYGINTILNCHVLAFRHAYLMYKQAARRETGTILFRILSVKCSAV